jgi:hypothetical protein
MADSRICDGFRALRAVAVVAPDSVSADDQRLSPVGIVWCLQLGLLAQSRDRLYITEDGSAALSAATGHAVCDEQAWVAMQREQQSVHRGLAACPTYGRPLSAVCCDVDVVVEICRFARATGYPTIVVSDAIAEGLLTMCEECGAIRARVAGTCRCQKQEGGTP